MKTYRTQQGKIAVVLELDEQYQKLVNQDPKADVIVCAALIKLPESQRVVSTVTGLTQATVDQWNILLKSMNDITVELVTTDIIRSQMSQGTKPS